MLIRKADLIKKGYESLQDAEAATKALEYREAEIHVGMAEAAARLADALGDKSFSVSTRQAHNW